MKKLHKWPKQNTVYAVQCNDGQQWNLSANKTNCIEDYEKNNKEKTC